MAAAQLLYRLAVTGEPFNPEKLYTNYVSELEEGVASEDKEVTLNPLPDLEHLKLLLHGIHVDLERIDAVIDRHLLSNWSRERTSPLLIAIFRAAIYELMHQPKLSTGVLLNEYTTLAAGFFNDPELGFANAFLQAAAKDVRK